MKKMHLKLALDIFMVVALPCLMAYSLIGENFHEVLGTVMGCVFIVHNVLNRAFHKNIFRGKYNANRIVMTVVDVLLLIDILLLLFSGVVLSAFVFSFVNFDSAYMTSRMLHLCASYWGFLLMSFHAGLHVPVVRFLNFARNDKRVKQDDNNVSKNGSDDKKRDNVIKIILFAVVVLISAFGIYCFIKNNFFQYLFLRTHFVFLDFERPRIFFFAEYISVMILFATVGASVKKLCKHKISNIDKA